MILQWLDNAMRFSGLDQAKLARALESANFANFERSKVNKMLKGTRRMAAEEMLAISRITHFPLPETVEASPPEPTRLVGKVSAGSTMISFADGQGPFDEVNGAPTITPDTVAVEIEGDSLGRTFDGWLLFYNRRRDPPSSHQIGRLCVAGLRDGRVVAKTLYRGQLPGRFNLISNTEPPIYDAEVDWASEVIFMMPR